MYFVFIFLSRKKIEMSISNHATQHMPVVTKSVNSSKKKRPAPKVTRPNNTPVVSVLL